MALFGGVWRDVALCGVMCGYVVFFVALCSVMRDMWRYMAICGDIWCYVAFFGDM